MIAVLLVDDQALLRQAFATMLELEDDIEVAGQCTNGQEAVDFVRANRVDVCLMDIEMPVRDGTSATAEIRVLPEPPEVVILTTFDRDDYLFSALKAGAAGFLLKTAEPEELIASVRTVASGQALLAPEVTRRVISQAVSATDPGPAASPGLERLTDREREVLVLMAHGLSNSEIAAKMFVGEATVKSHVSSCFNKLDVRDRVQAVIHAYQHGLVR